MSNPIFRIRMVTAAELKANKQIGWYAHGKAVYQVITLSPRKVKFIGHLESAPND